MIVILVFVQRKTHALAVWCGMESNVVFLISNIAGSILGSAADSWFADTKLGIWFYNKVDDVSTWASKKLGLKVLQDEGIGRKNILMFLRNLTN